ncbi:MAG TPA: hypothetical protein VIH99_05430 [Bdellovibrionota bacterium]
MIQFLFFLLLSTIDKIFSPTQANDIRDKGEPAQIKNITMQVEQQTSQRGKESTLRIELPFQKDGGIVGKFEKVAETFRFCKARWLLAKMPAQSSGDFPNHKRQKREEKERSLEIFFPGKTHSPNSGSKNLQTQKNRKKRQDRQMKLNAQSKKEKYGA